MPTQLELQCAVILKAALETEIGLVVTTNNVVKARASLYLARKAIGDVELRSLHIRTSPNNSERELWIIRRTIASIQGFTFAE